mgnify:CR=1 FL=1
MSNLSHIKKQIEDGKYVDKIVVHTQRIGENHELNISIEMMNESGSAVGFGQCFKLRKSMEKSLSETFGLLTVNAYMLTSQSRHEYRVFDDLFKNGEGVMVSEHYEFNKPKTNND